MVGTKKLDIVVFDKQERNVVVVHVVIPRAREHEKLERYHEGAGKDVGLKGISSAFGDRSTWGCDSHTGKLAPAE